MLFIHISLLDNERGDLRSQTTAVISKTHTIVYYKQKKSLKLLKIPNGN